MKTLAYCSAALAAVLLAACGGGSSGPEPVADAPTEVPASATVSPAAFVSFTGAQAPSETRDPMDINKAMPPTSETDEPAPV